MTEYEIVEIVIPESIDAPDAAGFIEAAGIQSLVEADDYGTDELWHSPADILPFFKDPGNPRLLFGVRLDGALVARAVFDWQTSDDTSAFAKVEVLPDYRRRGIGTALADHLDSLIRASGRRKILSWAVARAADGERLASPTGFGSVPLATPATAFLLARGFTLEQVERASRLGLPLDASDLRKQLDAATARSGPDYALHYWSVRTPERWLEQMAMLHTRMSTDAPSAGLEVPEDVWTVERVIENETNHAQAKILITAAVEHVPSGTLAGYTTLAVPHETGKPVFQDDTLVLKEHRGHKLGMLLKVANLSYLEREYPGRSSVITWNAEENRFMLDVNEAVGFEPIGYEGAWKKLLS